MEFNLHSDMTTKKMIWLSKMLYKSFSSMDLALLPQTLLLAISISCSLYCCQDFCSVSQFLELDVWQCQLSFYDDKVQTHFQALEAIQTHQSMHSVVCIYAIFLRTSHAQQILFDLFWKKHVFHVAVRLSYSCQHIMKQTIAADEG